MRARTRPVRIAALALLLACVPGAPDAIIFGADLCGFCRMQISDKRFAAALVTKKGRTLKFDSIECLVDYYRTPGRDADVASVWVSDFRNPGRLLDASTASFIDIGAGRTPMGRGLAAVATARDAAALDAKDPSRIRTWRDLL